MLTVTCRFLNTVILAGSLCLAELAWSAWQTEDAILMGTSIRIEVWHHDAGIRQQGIAKALEAMEKVNHQMSPYVQDSQLSKINRFAHERPVAVDHDLFSLIQKSIEVSNLTRGAFDITFASVGHLFNYHKQTRPNDETIERAKNFIDYRYLVLDEERNTVFFAKQGVKIDLGGIAKGHAVDQATWHLHRLGIKHALVSAGGDTRVSGDRLGRPWQIGIRDPRKTEEIIITLPSQNTALSTSGDYEKYFVEEGITYHHILHPETGKSAREIRSASVLGKDATTTDALSTSVFVLGIGEGLQLLNSLAGFEGVLIDHDGNLHYSEGLKQGNPGVGQGQ